MMVQLVGASVCPRLEAWTQLGADIDGEASSDVSGDSVSLSAASTILAVGARHNNGDCQDGDDIHVYASDCNAGHAGCIAGTMRPLTLRARLDPDGRRHRRRGRWR